MTEILLLHRIVDAEHCVSTGSHEGKLLFSTYAGIDGYLKDNHDIECRCISQFISEKQQLEYYQEASVRCERVLKYLDGELGSVICQKLGLVEMPIYKSLFTYHGKNHLLGYIAFRNALDRIITENGSQKIISYDYALRDFFSIDTHIGDLLNAFFPEMCSEIIISSNEALQPSYVNDRRMARLSILLKHPDYLINKIREKYLEQSLFARVKKLKVSETNMLICEDLYDLEVLKRDTEGMGLIYLNAGGTNPHIPLKEFDTIMPNLPDIHSKIRENHANDSLDRLFFEEVGIDLEKGFSTYFKPLVALVDLLREGAAKKGRSSIDIGIWGNPPISGAKALIFEYLKTQKVTILGGQHGCVDGDCYQPWYGDSDFNMADHFISYGFTNDDLKRLYPDLTPKSTVHPLGSTRVVQTKSRKRQPLQGADILFPITDALSFFNGAIARVMPDRLLAIQIKMLDELEALDNCKVIVKPFMYSGLHNSAVWSRLTRSKKLQLLENVPLRDVLKSAPPRIIAIEYVSQPLYDALPLDCEIFLLGNNLHYFEPLALELLKKRVWYFEDPDELFAALKKYLNGDLPRKRDNSFIDHYFKTATRSSILDLAHELADEHKDNRLK